MWREERGERRKGLRWKKNDRKKAENIRIGDQRRELGEDNVEQEIRCTEETRNELVAVLIPIKR